MIKLMMILGLRRGEAIRLRRVDFAPEAGTLKIVDAKNRKSRLLPMPDGVGRDLRAWLIDRPACDYDHLFCSRQGSALNPRAIYRMMDRLADVAQIAGKNLHPHMLRHTAATMALRSSGDLFATQHLLGFPMGCNVPQLALRSSPVGRTPGVSTVAPCRPRAA